MDSSKEIKRKAVPKWRSLIRTPKTELVSSGTLHHDPSLSKSLIQSANSSYYIWQKDPTLENAIDAIDSCIVLEDKALFVGPAKQVLNSDDATETNKLLANYVIHGQETATEDLIRTPVMDLRFKLKRLKEITRVQPRNCLSYLEQARIQTILGNVESADKLFSIALALAPDHRLTLRFFSRFKVHMGEADEAHWRLKKTPALKYDPWLQATEIAISDLLGVSPKSAKWGKSLLSQKSVSPLHLSELLSAIGTLDFSHGKVLQARKSIRASLAQPTENAISQALWFNNQEGMNFDVGDTPLKMICAFEARAQQAIFQSQWEEAVRNIEYWQKDEEFSEQAAIDGSYYAMSTLNDHDRAAALCYSGLEANPNSPGILNNLCVSLCKMGKLDEAQKYWAKLKLRSPSWSEQPVTLATKALLDFSSGDSNVARTSFTDAVSAAARDNNPLLHFRVRCHWLLEECLHKQFRKDDAVHLVNKLSKDLTRFKAPNSVIKAWEIMTPQILDDKNFIDAKTDIQPLLPFFEPPDELI